MHVKLNGSRVIKNIKIPVRCIIKMLARTPPQLTYMKMRQRDTLSGSGGSRKTNKIALKRVMMHRSTPNVTKHSVNII